MTCLERTGVDWMKLGNRVVFSEDTRTLEIFLSILTWVWVGWVVYLRPHQELTLFMEANSGRGFWAMWALMNAAVTLLSAIYKRPHLRKLAAFSASMYWLHVFYLSVGASERQFFPWMGGVMAVAELWVLLSRSAKA